jgi:uncharacterized membrane protein
VYIKWNGLIWIIECYWNINLTIEKKPNIKKRNLTFSYANMVVVTFIWLAVFNLICLRLLPIDSGLVQTFKFSCT